MIEFSEEYLCGVFIIDEQHKILCGLINELIETVEGKKNNLDVIIEELQNYSKYHFATEEAFWTKNSREEVEKHKELHDRYILFMNDLPGKKNDNEEFRELIKYLEEWIVIHIKDEDRNMLRYSSHLHSNN